MRRIDDPRDLLVMSWELEKEEVIKFKPIYEALHQFLGEEGFTHYATNDEKVEDLYWERWVPSGAKEQHIWWRVAKTINPYIRYFVTLDFQTLLATKAEVAYKGKKVSAEKIDMIVRLRCYLQWDYENKFQDSIAWKVKKAFFNKIYQEEYKKYKEDLERFSWKAHRLTKSLFEMAGGEQAPAVFQPPMGYKEQ
jgi:hypothetical protein